MANALQQKVFEASRLAWLWSGGNRFVLQRCRRSDRAHVDFSCGLREMALADTLEQAMQRYSPQRGCTRNLVMSNFRRRQINERMQANAARKHSGTKIPIDGEVYFECFVGTKLIGCNGALPGIVNGAFLLVTAIVGNTIRLRDEDTAEQLECTPAQLARHTRLRWALTLCAVQGRSLSGTIAIHDTRSRHFDAPYLYVGLSRATNGANVHIAS